MRLAICTPFLTGMGGMERVVLHLAKHYNAPVYCLSYDEQRTYEEFQSLDVRPAGSISDKMPFGRRVLSAAEAGQYFYNLKLDEDYDVINPHQTPAEWIRNRNGNVLWYCYAPNRETFDLYQWRQRRRGLFGRAAFWAASEVFKRIEFQTVPKIEKIITSGETSRAKIKQYLNRDAEVCYLGVDRPKNRHIAREQFFFYPSRLVPEKDIEFAIAAFQQAGLEGWKLVIAGNSSNERYANHLRSLCGGDITIEENISEHRLADLYASCTATVFTPVNEDFGLVPLEGMSYGKPCLAKDEGGMKETVIDGVDGYRSQDVLGLAKSMQMLAMAPDLAKSMGEAGKSKVQARFTWERFITEFGRHAKGMLENDNNKVR